MYFLGKRIRNVVPTSGTPTIDYRTAAGNPNQSNVANTLNQIAAGGGSGDTGALTAMLAHSPCVSSPDMRVQAWITPGRPCPK